MASILITGSTDGVGRATAETLLDDGHRVVVHARTAARLAAVRHLIDHGAEAIIGDLANQDEVRALIEQANALGRFDAVIHNAGVMHGPVLPVNVTAPYLMTALIPASRQIYLSSSMHRGGRPNLASVDWTGNRETSSYSDAKLFVTTLMAAVARRCPGAPDDLSLAHVTQAWLATTDDPEVRVSGRYWFHQHTEEPHPAVRNDAFQDELLMSLADSTGVAITP
jgi:NAD(P)-dependent dehydrogenase (short-subunit alcohol dehydrogenase family)